MNSSDMHERLLDSLSKVKSDSVCVFMSGGVDSASILYSVLELGKTPTCYTFTFEDSKSRDYYIAKATCKKESVRFVPVFLPRALSALCNDIYLMHDRYGCRKKTEYECTWPFIYVYPRIREDYVAGGFGSEAHFVLTKRGMLHFRNRPDEFRREYWSKDNPNQRKQHAMLSEQYGKETVFPYMEPETASMFSGVSWDEINTPHHKQVILDAFSDKFSNRKVWPQNLQIGGKVSAHFSSLLKTPMNRNGYKSVVGIFNDVDRGYRVSL